MAEDLHDNQKTLLEDAVEQFVDAQLEGKEPDIEEFVNKYPDFEDQVRKRIQKLQKIDGLFSSLVKTGASEFDNIMDEHDLIGKKLGSFEIVKIIGRGGMGVVYLARDTKLKRFVAVKSIPTTLANNTTARTRFRREAEVLASLNHPNIAVIHDILEQQDHSCYLILEYIEGETLAERIAREPLELNEVLSICGQIAEAVSAAHKQGIVHRDIKPGNIKITPEGRVKVLDFGLARTSPGEDDKGEAGETRHGRIIGTPAYMSPEQARGKGSDYRTDIWSFGCLMYQMLTGRLPFEGDTATNTMARVLECQPDWEALPQEVPASIQTLMQRCLEKDPDLRPGDIKEAALKIRESLNGPVKAAPTRLRKVVTFLGAAIIIVIIAIAVRYVLVQPSAKEIIPTKSKEAWAYYLRGEKYYSEDFQEKYLNWAIQMWEKAVEYDPNFALAHAQLSHAYCLLYWNHGRNSEDIEKAKEHVQVAEKLDPDLPEVHLAWGHYYYHGQRNYELALNELNIFLKSRPRASQALAYVGWIYKRQGKFEEALQKLIEAYEYRPEAHVYSLHIALIYKLLGDYKRAKDFYDKTISLAPDRPRGYIGKMRVLLRQGRIKDAKAVQKEFASFPDVVNDLEVEQTLIDIDVYEKNYKAALDRLAQSPETEDFSNWSYSYPNAFRRAMIYRYMWQEDPGRKDYEDLAREHFDKAQVIFERQFEKYPKDSSYESVLGIIYAGLGLREKAISAGEEAVEDLPISKDAASGPWRVQNLALIYTIVGEYDKAFDQIEILLEKPSELSIPLLKLNPAWAPLRDEPRFTKLVDAAK